MPKPKDNTLSLADVQDPTARQTLPHLCTAYRVLQEEIAESEAAKKILYKQINEVASRAGLQKVRDKDGGWQLVQVRRTYSTIVAERLLERGVSMEDIEYATNTSESVYYSVLEG